MSKEGYFTSGGLTHGTDWKHFLGVFCPPEGNNIQRQCCLTPILDWILLLCTSIPQKHACFVHHHILNTEHGDCIQITPIPDRSLISNGMILTWLAKAQCMKLNRICRIKAEPSRKHIWKTPLKREQKKKAEWTTQRWSFLANSFGVLQITLKLVCHWISSAWPQKEVLLSSRVQWRVSKRKLSTVILDKFLAWIDLSLLRKE